MSYTSPRTWVAAETVSAAQLNTHLRDQLLHIAGTAGFTGTPSATVGIEPASGYFMGAASQNRHAESGTGTRTGSAASITFANAFASNPRTVTVPTSNIGSIWVASISTTGGTIDASSDASFNWIAEGAD